MQLINLFDVYLNVLEENNIDYCVTGSVATIIYGEPRLTNDIDLVISLSENQIDNFYTYFPYEKYYMPPKEVIIDEIKRFNRGHINIIEHNSGFKADIYFVGKDNLLAWALENKKRFSFLGHDISVAPPEYVIIKKIEFYREGGSSKHLTDIKGVIKHFNGKIDFKFIEQNLFKLGLLDIWKNINK